MRRALEGVDVAYYLIHAMGSPDSFERLDRRAATIFAEAARDAGVRRIVYLGGLGAGPDLSPHLASRQEVGRLLAATGVATIEFRASIVIGSGSLSFELVRPSPSGCRSWSRRAGCGRARSRSRSRT